MDNDNLISIKGGKDGLRLSMDEASAWQTILDALRTQISQRGSFFAGARLTVDVGERVLSEEEFTALLSLMDEFGLKPETLATSARESRNIAQAAGMHTRTTPRQAVPAAPVQSSDDALLLTRTVRSGQVVRHHGHITLIGDVNPGAEVIAGGSVVVWGRLRGLVHAGALGNADTFICALELRPTQLRIAHLIARTPEDSSHEAHGVLAHRDGPTLPEVARIEADHIIVESWDYHRR